ncbi:MAG: helix-turn-helix domain-containing protein, partial [Clostridium sp.]
MVIYKKIRSVLYMTGKKIRELRKANNLTMRDLAEKSGTASSYISDLENGKIKNPSGIKLKK